MQVIAMDGMVGRVVLIGDESEEQVKKRGEDAKAHMYSESYSSQAVSYTVAWLVASSCRASAANGAGGKGGGAASRYASHRAGDGGRAAAAALKRAIDLMADAFRRSPGMPAGWLFGDTHRSGDPLHPMSALLPLCP